MKTLLITFFLAIAVSLQAQNFPKKELLKKLKADKISMDQDNGDGVFMARNKKTKKWGMYQWMYEGTNTDMLIPMKYDKINYFPFNGLFTAVYNNNKVGFYTSKWSYGDNAKQTVNCVYDDFRRFNADGKKVLAVKKGDKWGWVNWRTGEETSEFIYNTPEDLPIPNYAK